MLPITVEADALCRASAYRQKIGKVENDCGLGKSQLALEEALYIDRLVRKAVLDRHERQVERVRCVQ